MKRRIITIFLIILFFLLQSTVFQKLTFGGVAPNLILVLTSCFGFMRGKKEGMFVGFIGGFLIDVFYGGGILGVFALIYTVMGYLNGMFHHVLYPEDVKLPLLFIAASDFVYCLISYVILFLFRTRMNFPGYFVRIIIPEVVYTVIITLIIYRAILFINRKLEDDEKAGEAKFV